MVAIIIQGTVCAISIYVVYRAVSVRFIPKVRFFLPLTISAFFVAIGYLLELLSTTAESALMAQRIQVMGTPFLTFFCYLFIRDYGNRPMLKKWQLTVLALVPCIVVVGAFLYPLATQYFRSVGFEALPTARLVFDKGVLFYISAAYNFLLVGLALVEILANFPTKGKRWKDTRLFLVLAGIAPNAVVAILRVGSIPAYMDIGPALLVLSLFFIGGYILRQRMQDWLPYAREAVVEYMSDALVLYDNAGGYLDCNGAAKSLFPSLGEWEQGMPVSEIEGFPPKETMESSPPKDFCVQQNGRAVWMRASCSPVVYEGKEMCICVLFYDVTELHYLEEELERRATIDSLSGVYNRVTFFRAAERDFDLTIRAKRESVLIILDIDNLKKINDTHGHIVGDMVISRVGETIRQRMRHTDIVGRYGGDEFCIFLPATPLESACFIVEDIMQGIRSVMIHTPKGEAFHITVSVGMAKQDRERHDVMQELFTDADAALYQAKQAGRDNMKYYGQKAFPKAVK